MPGDLNSQAAKAGLIFDETTGAWRWPGNARAERAAQAAANGQGQRSHHSQHEQDVAALKGSPDRTAAILRAYRAEVATIRRDVGTLMPHIIAQREREARAKAQAALTQLEVEAGEARSRLDEAIESAKGKAANSLDAASHAAAAHAWLERIKPILARCTSEGERTARIEQFAAEAGKQGDLATLRALRAELPAYLEAHESPALREHRQRAGQTFEEADAGLRQVLDGVRAASLPHLSAEEALAYELAEAVKPVEWTVKPNLEMARRELTAGVRGWNPGGKYLEEAMAKVPVLFGWEPRSTIPIDDEPLGAPPVTATPASTIRGVAPAYGKPIQMGERGPLTPIDAH